MSEIRSKNLLSHYSEEENKNECDSSSHSIRLLKKNHQLYFFKDFKGHPEVDARSELVISEFIRILLPREPVTDLIYYREEDSAPVGLLSEKIEGFKSFESLWFIKLVSMLFSNSITGFGEVCALLMLTCEHDGKVSGNIGINNKRQVVKLDGGETMLAKYDRELNIRYPMTEKDIRWLPLPPAFVKKRNINWFYGNAENNLIRFIFFLLTYNSSIRREINSTFLKFVLLPDICIKQLINYSATKECYPDDLAEQFQKRREHAKEMALKNASFRTYIKSTLAENDIKKHLCHLENFNLFNKIKISENIAMPARLVNEEFQKLKEAAICYPDSYNLSFKMGCGVVILLLSMLLFHLRDLLPLPSIMRLT